MTTTEPADLYLRLSDARHEEALDGREARLREHAAQLGWAVHRVIIENDLVPGNGDGRLRPASAWKRRKITTPSGRVELRTIRPGFRSMLDDLAAGRATAILAEDLDRLLRQPRDNEDLLDAVEQAGATCKSLSGSLTLTEGGTEAEKFTARIMAASANKASADTARRVANARERYAGQSYQGGRRPYGFQPDPGSPRYHKRLIMVSHEAQVIRNAATDILDRGVSLKAIARTLRDQGEPTVTGTTWTAKTLRDVLLKPAVAGLAVTRQPDGAGPQRELLVEAPWPAILDRDRWEALRDHLTDTARRTNTSRANEPRWLVSGFATCGVCSGLLRAGGGRDRAPAYVGSECNHIRRNAALVDQHITSLVIARLNKPDAGDLLKPPPHPQVDARKLRAEARKLKARKAAQVRMHSAGDLDDSDLAVGLKAIRGQLAAIEARLAASAEADPLAEFRGKPAEAVWEGLSVARRRAVVQTLIRAIVVNQGGRRGRGFDPDLLDIDPQPGV